MSTEDNKALVRCVYEESINRRKVSYLRPTTLPIAGLDRTALMKALENIP